MKGREPKKVTPPPPPLFPFESQARSSICLGSPFFSQELKSSDPSEKSFHPPANAPLSRWPHGELSSSFLDPPSNRHLSLLPVLLPSLPSFFSPHLPSLKRLNMAPVAHPSAPEPSISFVELSSATDSSEDQTIGALVPSVGFLSAPSQPLSNMRERERDLIALLSLCYRESRLPKEVSSRAQAHRSFPLPSSLPRTLRAGLLSSSDALPSAMEPTLLLPPPRKV